MQEIIYTSEKDWVYQTSCYLPWFNHIIEPFNAFSLVRFGRQCTQGGLMEAHWGGGSHIMLDITKEPLGI